MAAALGPLAYPSRSARPRSCLNLTYRLSLCQFDNVAAALGPLACFSRSVRPRLYLIYHPTYLKCVYLTAIKHVHSTYKKCSSNLEKCAFDLQNVYIWPTKVVHPTYKSCASDLQKLCIQPTNIMCIRPTLICVQPEHRPLK